MMHKDIIESDRYCVIIDGIWERYTDDEQTARAYARKNGNAHVQDIVTGEIIERVR